MKVSSSPAKSPSKVDVLFIDNDSLLLGMIEKELEQQEGIRFSGEENAVKGLEKAKEIDPGIIVLDPVAEGLSGEKLLQEIRQSDCFENTKVMILSKKIDHEHIQQYEALNVDDFIQKPFQISELIFRLKKLT
ncbi:response regulator [Gracilimonas sediminicola]|uniref:Response regulator n=1 Tax=Gracilimonas sediminicola TaxID=2952158 RepID=A0A9X2L153_9BACT|nr:response regulator [Gracilimonas sediminicola]MCP9290416.1 response regulator [Gracilimonas sediminicola]